MKFTVEFKGSCLKQDKATFTYRKVVNLFIVYYIDTWSRDLNTKVTLGDCLFGAVKLTKNDNPDKNGYSGYGIGFDGHAQFPCPLVNEVKMLYLVWTIVH